MALKFAVLLYQLVVYAPILPLLPGSAPYRFRRIKRKDDPPIAEQLVTYAANACQLKSVRTYYIEATSFYNILQGRASLGALPVWYHSGLSTRDQRNFFRRELIAKQFAIN